MNAWVLITSQNPRGTLIEKTMVERYGYVSILQDIPNTKGFMAIPFEEKPFILLLFAL